MSVDAQGYFWLADPTTAAAVIAVMTGLVIWLHRLTMADQPAQPAATPAPADDTRAVGAGRATAADRATDTLAQARDRRRVHRQPAA